MSSTGTGHTVLRAHVVVQDFPLRITAADAWGDAIVVGTADGALVTFGPVQAVKGAQQQAGAEPEFEARLARAFRFRSRAWRVRTHIQPYAMRRRSLTGATLAALLGHSLGAGLCAARCGPVGGA